jgi:hypothetical protein
VKKNPRQLFSPLGIFNPLIEHRQRRVLRRTPAPAGIHGPGRSAATWRWLPFGRRSGKSIASAPWPAGIPDLQTDGQRGHEHLDPAARPHPGNPALGRLPRAGAGGDPQDARVLAAGTAWQRRAQRPGQPHATIAGMASFCRTEELARLGAASSLTSWLAMSLGGMVASAWAQGAPRRRSPGVSWSAPASVRFSPPHHRLRPRAWPALVAILLDRSGGGAGAAAFSSLTSGLARDRSPGGGRMGRHPPVPAGEAPERPPATAGRGKPTGRRLSGAGGDPGAGGKRRTGWWTPRCSGAIARRWHCPLAVHPEAGHDLPLDDGAVGGRGNRSLAKNPGRTAAGAGRSPAGCVRSWSSSGAMKS